MTPVVDSTAYQSWYNVDIADSAVVVQRTVDPSAIFGNLSTVSHFDPATVGSHPAIEWQGSVVVVALLSIYCYILFRYRAEIRVSFKSAFSLEDTLFVFESLTLDFARFLNLTRVVLAFSLAIVVCIFAGVWQTLWIVCSVSVAVWLILQLSALARYILTGFDYNADRWASIKSITRLNQAIIAIILPPLVIMLCSMTQYLWVVVIVVAILMIYHFLRILRYFKLAGFSILQWILYLCAVEMMPFTLLLGGSKWIDLLI